MTNQEYQQLRKWMNERFSILFEIHSNPHDIKRVVHLNAKLRELDDLYYHDFVDQWDPDKEN